MAGFTLIEDTGPLASPAASITFNTGLTDYTKFRLTLYVIKDGSAGVAQLRINGDTGANYAWQQLKANSTTASGARSTGNTSYHIANTSLTASLPALFTCEVSKPLSTTPGRITSSASVMVSSAIEFVSQSGEWNNTADLISSISILASAGDFAANTRAVLEGAA